MISALKPLAVLLFAALLFSPARAACEMLRHEMHEEGPRLLASFPTAPKGPLKDTAFLYDNAVAAIALVGCGETAKAAQIGDALLIAQEYDRFWHDGRLRNAYLAGTTTDRPVKLSGWWDNAQAKWVEDRYQAGSDTGNQAWAMLALLTIYEATKDARYLHGAERLGRYVEGTFAKDKPAGFTGGTFGHEPHPERNAWKSTEHNTDLAAAFERLARTEVLWSKQAQQAQGFVEAMWRPSCHCFAAGTAEDGRNKLLALDAQIWPLLAFSARHFPGALAMAEARLKVEDGYAYSEVRQGIWTEGTAQMALVLALNGREKDAEVLRGVVERARTPEGYYATNGASMPTGFGNETDQTQPRLYFHLPHLAATAWAALAERGFNPFRGK